ncbi:serine hydrolase [Qipengyuania zhejiangensis]|uniref:serine hydrolase n=1 Tax=Qipengyuania zhejiangensis TaxID=3077782 RepID=UPI002D783FAE|nr:serine hydrolase [Qipengyuania sp. Z2]
MKLIRLVAAATLGVAAQGVAAHEPVPPLAIAKPVPAPDYEGEARRIVDALDATGMVAAVMVDGKVVYTGSFGVLEEGSDNPVTPDTLFPIASISKAFTTTALAILVDRGELDWDDPVRKYIPEFAMYDPWVSERFTIRDALTHRSGLPLGAGDLLIWPDGNAAPSDIVAALPHLRPTTGFRDGFAYDNLLYVIAGEVIERVSGKSWSDFVTDEIFTPAGMANCAADQSRIAPGRTVASGHERAAGETSGTPVDPRMNFSLTWAAAGGIFCTASDMMVWSKLWLDRGVTATGTRLVSEKQAAELWKGVTPVGSGAIPETGGSTNLSLYALGWFVRDWEGTPMVTHSGGAPGSTSNLILLPQENIAVFAASNDYMSTASAYTRQIADDLVGGRNEDVIAAAAKANREANDAALALVSDAISPPADAARPSLPLSAYAGTYRDPWYGNVTISLRADGLFIDMQRSAILDGPLTPFAGDTFVAIWPDRTIKADALVTFEVADGAVTRMTMKAVSDITDFSYDFHDLDLVKQ